MREASARLARPPYCAIVLWMWNRVPVLVSGRAVSLVRRPSHSVRRSWGGNGVAVVPGELGHPWWRMR